MKPIMSVKEARKILGKTVDNMTDEEIREAIINLSFIAKFALKDASDKLSRGEKLSDENNKSHK